MAAQWLEVRAPAAQEEGTRSQVLRWLKQLGEPVAAHEPLIEIETDKVTVEVAAPGTGVLAESLKGEQQEISPGDLLGRIRAVEGTPAGEPAAGAALERAAEESAVPAAAGPNPPAGSVVRGTGAASAPAAGTPRLSPAVRRLLAEHGLDPAAVEATGEGGRITVDDVMRTLAGPVAGAGVPQSRAEATGTAPLARAEPGSAAAPASHSVPHSALRRRIAARMVESLLHIAPHVTTVFEVDLGAVLAHRERHRGAFERRGVALTLTAYFVRAAVAAIGAVPQANSRWTDSALEVFDSVDFGIGTAVADGLVVPVLRHAETLDLFQSAQGIEELVRKARAGQLAPEDVRGGTFTLSNHGVSGSLLATPVIIHQPQSAILGVGKLEKRAVVIEEHGEEHIVARPRCYATLTIDHRVMDGEQANRFMQVFARQLGNWPD